MKDIKLITMGSQIPTSEEKILDKEASEFYEDVNSYMYYEKLTEDKIKNYWIFSAVLESDDKFEDIYNMTKTVASNPNIYMIVYNFRNVKAGVYKRMIETLDTLYNYGFDSDYLYDPNFHLTLSRDPDKVPVKEEEESK